MIIIHLLHILISGGVFVKEYGRFESVEDFFHRASELEVAGLATLGVLFVVAVLSLVREVWRRNRPGD